MGIVQKLIKYLGTVLSIIMVGITILLGFSVRWMFKTWPNLAVDELVFHLTEPLDGTNQDMIIEYIMQCIIPMVFVLILFSYGKTTHAPNFPKSANLMEKRS